MRCWVEGGVTLWVDGEKEPRKNVWHLDRVEGERMGGGWRGWVDGEKEPLVIGWWMRGRHVTG